MYETITITMKSGDYAQWRKDKWDDYDIYDDKFFIVKKKKVWIGIYNIDCVESIVIE